MVPAADGILEIGDPEDLEVQIDVLSEDAVKIRPGQTVRLSNWGGPGDLHAHIRSVEPSAFTKVSALGVDEQRVWVYADFVDDNVEQNELSPEIPSGRNLLGDGYRVEARVVVWKRDGVLKAPSGSLFRDGENGDWAVYRVIGQRAVLTPVTRGQDNGIEAEIEKGLNEGDEVILHPGDRVEDGVKVRARG
jgi:HlyD family secretion protein